MVFMTYANVVFSYGKGTEDFIRRAAEIGMNGLILPDVPFEEKEEFDSVCRQYGLDLISLIAGFANGDARTALNTLEMVVLNGEKQEDTTRISRGNCGAMHRPKNRFYTIKNGGRAL